MPTLAIQRPQQCFMAQGQKQCNSYFAVNLCAMHVKKYRKILANGALCRLENVNEQFFLN